ncbi:hypothetical protein Tco_0111230 [Tanacetum coccineum]
MSMEALQAQEDLIKSIESFSKSLIVSLLKTCLRFLLHAWDNFNEAMHAQPEEVQDQSEDFSVLTLSPNSTDEDSFSSTIFVEYVEASHPNSEHVSSKVMEFVIPDVEGLENDILLIKKTIPS